MNLIALLIAVAAVVVFLVDWSRSKALIPLGLALVTAAWIIQLIVASGTVVAIR